MSEQKITPYLWYDKNAEEAMNLYVDVFNGAPGSKKKSQVVSMMRYPEGVTEGPLAGMGGKVLNGIFELDGQRFMAMDGGPSFKFSEAISMYVECHGQEEVDYFWEKLSAIPEAEQCGWLCDKFGLSWQIIPAEMIEMMSDSDHEKAGRAMQAMLQMKKIDIAKMREAFEGKK